MSLPKSLPTDVIIKALGSLPFDQPQLSAVAQSIAVAAGDDDRTKGLNLLELDREVMVARVSHVVLGKHDLAEPPNVDELKAAAHHISDRVRHQLEYEINARASGVALDDIAPYIEVIVLDALCYMLGVDVRGHEQQRREAIHRLTEQAMRSRSQGVAHPPRRDNHWTPKDYDPF